ncbi:DUF4376 domain-containing protein [Nitrosovibrio sp. Nv6]|uniref:DUF4376 domain-containing protein n=1 Tax=Nitrosovibrio sp. Nv6 TaxID=1855340 RepID=UPI0008C19A7C|nr:DUF4376 domain-containing protein [Nitrosovibrio sp. Nv6]SEO64673.1 protein of unknown function [Nitrosovibrio sp. Nv6]
MKITIIQDDGLVGVDSVFRTVDLADLDPDIHAIQFDTGTGTGHIEYDPEAQVRKPNRPVGVTAFRPYQKYVTRWKAAGAPPKRTLAEVKADARRQINSRRDTLEAAGFAYLGKTFDSDNRSVQRISVAALAASTALAAGQPWSMDWTAQDNSAITLDAEAMGAMPDALASYALDLHNHAKAKKAEIDACTTIAQVEAIQW